MAVPMTAYATKTLIHNHPRFQIGRGSGVWGVRAGGGRRSGRGGSGKNSLAARTTASITGRAIP
jgi:hypothetical protein